MTEPNVPTFEVGKRAYWISESESFYPLSVSKPPTIWRDVRSGVVMSTGPAVTQVWNDNPSDLREHHSLTFANDKIWPDRESANRIKLEKDRQELERYEATKKRADEDLCAMVLKFRNDQVGRKRRRGRTA